MASNALQPGARSLLGSAPMTADPESFYVTIDRWTLAEELWSFGEDRHH
jgi:hypothetical protein